MNDCAFQYATEDGKIFEDTNLISYDEAEEMWDKYVPIFEEHLKDGKTPEMAIWTGMCNSSDYHTTEKHWCGEDFIIKDGQLYTIVVVN